MASNTKVRYETISSGRRDLTSILGFFFAGVALIAMWSTSLQANMQTTHQGKVAFVEIKKERKTKVKELRTQKTR